MVQILSDFAAKAPRLTVKTRSYRSGQTLERMSQSSLGHETEIDPLEGHTMMNFIKNFRKDEDGAVTVDWVVLTAAVVGLAVAAYSSIETGATGLTANTGTFLDGRDPN